MENNTRNLQQREEEEEEAAGSYILLGDGDAASNSDNSRLRQLGYKQELRRSLTAIANFSVTFSIVSVITGLTTLYSTGLTFGGPLTMVYGWPIVGLMTMIVGLSMAEICSAYPTSAGLYYWSARLCGNEWGPFASWLTGWILGECRPHEYRTLDGNPFRPGFRFPVIERVGDYPFT